ncbi:MAG: hypothetical protein ACRDYW_02325 [Acidimicrobiales bacterium]
MKGLTILRRAAIAAVVALALVVATDRVDGDGTATAATQQEHDGGHGHGQGGQHGRQGAAAVELGKGMRALWSDHMQWTYATVDAFFHNADALPPTLDRLLANQADIGAAIAPFYGQEAGDQLTELLTTHITLAVPVLQAAQAGDDAALQGALDDWYSNAQDVADLLAAANPHSWPQSATRPALEMHIDQTTAYAVDLLQGAYAPAIEHYDAALDHMLELADILAGGIVEQFPERFRS